MSEFVDLGRPDWQHRGACRGKPPHLWFPGRGELFELALARKVCAGCSVRADCLRYALEHDVVGVWGATVLEERQQLRARST